MRHVRVAVAASLLVLVVCPAIASAQTPTAPSAFTIGAEALLLWFKGNATPPLVTDGILGAPGTRVLLGGRDVDTNANPGFRLRTTLALGERWGLESSVLYVPTRTATASVASSGQPGSTNLQVPFFDVTIPGEDITSVSLAGQFAGRARATLSNSLLGADADGTVRVLTAGALRVDALGGFRYLRLREEFAFKTDSPNIPPRPADVWTTTDRFDATNNFYGAQVGLRARGGWGPWFVSGVAKLALGAMAQSVDIDGRLVTNDFNDFGAPQTIPGGYFALSTNSGHHARKVFAVVPELGLDAGYQITPSIALFAGYTFLYASSVVRAPQQINRNINPTGRSTITGQPPAPFAGPAEPSFRFNASSFWAQGLDLGVAFRF